MPLPFAPRASGATSAASDRREIEVSGYNATIRRVTLKELPQSRGRERGFLPAGALEDVDDYFYWLSTNCLTWRGLDSTAEALETYGHAEAARFRKEADAFRRDLIRGFETARRHSPLIRLRDGRWVPHYYEKAGLLHLGRAIPRARFAGEETFGAARLSTPPGNIDVFLRESMI